MLAMPRDKPIQIDSLKWLVQRDDPTWISGIGISLTNGTSSPKFTNDFSKFFTQAKEIKITNQIKTIVVTKSDENRELIFQGQQGSEDKQHKYSRKARQII